jgi:hypothetical protein
MTANDRTIQRSDQDEGPNCSSAPETICMKSGKGSRRLHCGPHWIRSVGPLLTISVLLISLGCATTHATLSLTAPSKATAGTPFSVTVNVLYEGKPDTVINSAIQFTSSDPAAILPPAYYFTPMDVGSHTWINAFTLSTPGDQTISGQIHDASGINGSVTLAVSP